MIELSFPGGVTTAKGLTEAAALVRPTLAKMVAKGVIYMQTVVKQNVPVDTGLLKSSVASEMLPPTEDTISGRVKVGSEIGSKSGAYYAIYVNDGTGQYAIHQELTSGRLKSGGIKPQQFMEKSAEQASPQIALYFAEAVADLTGSISR